jgi:hypothetical protein
VITIVITGELTGQKALLYERVKRQGRRRLVPTYRAFAHCTRTQESFPFAVVRDTSTQVFEGLEDPYSQGGECPPSLLPYRGVVREDGDVGFRIQLIETSGEHTDTLLGQGSVMRRHIQIHFGAAASNGCIMVAGRRREYRTRFERTLRAMLRHTSDIEVIVLPRACPSSRSSTAPE